MSTLLEPVDTGFAHRRQPPRSAEPPPVPGPRSQDAPSRPARQDEVLSGAAERGQSRPELHLMGEFALEQFGRPVSMPQSARRLLAFLAVHDHPLTRSYVSGCLWPDVTQERAAGNLRSTLWRLRQAEVDAVVSNALTVSLSPRLTVDLHDLLVSARACLSHVDVPDLSDRLVEDLLPDWYDDWLIVMRERLRQLRLHAFESLCEQFIERGLAGRAIDAGLSAIEIEPLRESAHRVLVKAHLAEGNAHEALRQYAAFVALLDRELGIRPSPAFQALVEPLLSARRRREAEEPGPCAAPRPSGR